jgi:hypothetical protein
MIDGERYFAIGDLLIDSDFVAVCLSRSTAPVFLLQAGTKISETAPLFFQRFIAGDFDF